VRRRDGGLREAVRTGAVAGDPVVGEIGEVIAGDMVGL
jgi:hypothetical protein